MYFQIKSSKLASNQKTSARRPRTYPLTHGRSALQFSREVAEIVAEMTQKDPRKVASTIYQYMASRQEAERSPRRKEKMEALIRFCHEGKVQEAAEYLVDAASFETSHGMTRRMFSKKISEQLNITIEGLRESFREDSTAYDPNLLNFGETAI